MERDVSPDREKEELFRLLSAAIEQSSELIYIADEQWEWPGPYITYVNDAFVRHFGYSREEVIGKPTHIIRGPATDIDALTEMRRVVTVERLPYRGETIAQRKNGEPLWTEYTVTPIEHLPGNSRHIVLNVRDVTEQHEARIRLQETAQAFEELFQVNPLPMCVYDPQTLLFVETNQAMQMRYGYSAEEFRQLSIQDIRPPEEHDRLIEQVEARSSSSYSEPNGTVYTHQSRSGEQLFVEVASHQLEYRGQPARLVVIYEATKRTLALRALEEREEQLQLITNNTVNMITVLDENLERLYMSPSCLTVIGYTPEEIPQYSGSWMHPDDRLKVIEAMNHHREIGSKEFMLNFRAIHKDGRRLWMESAYKVLRDEEGRFNRVIATTLDITERVKANDARIVALQQATDLAALTVALEETRELPDVIRVALKHSLNVLPFHEVLFWPLKEEHPRLMEALKDSTSRPISPQLRELLQQDDFRRLLRQGLVVVQPDVPSVLLPLSTCSLSMQQELVLPIKAEEHLYGVMVFKTEHALKLKEDIQQLMGAIRDRIAHAVERTLHLQQLADSREETLKTLGLVLEYRDYETKGHTDRVVEHSLRLGQQMGLTPAELEALRWGAYLHDTGKVAIPDQILLKPGRLTTEEFQVIQRHSQIGYEMLRHIATLPEASLQLILHHHEKWDGKGYPLGLTGTSIPLLARIFTVVDVYDALVSRRPYKEPMSHQDAMLEIVRCSGSMFDPVVVAVFERLMHP
jgi:PAS domain S-box-containing protein